jgi:hypothetical protein
MRTVILEMGAVALTGYVHRVGKTSLRQVVNLGPIPRQGRFVDFPSLTISTKPCLPRAQSDNGKLN